MPRLIRACLAEGKTWLGDWYFKVLPRVGEHVVIPPDYYEVTAIEHWPQMNAKAETEGPEVGLRVRVRELSDWEKPRS